MKAKSRVTLRGFRVGPLFREICWIYLRLSGGRISSKMLKNEPPPNERLPDRNHPDKGCRDKSGQVGAGKGAKERSNPVTGFPSSCPAEA